MFSRSIAQLACRQSVNMRASSTLGVLANSSRRVMQVQRAALSTFTRTCVTPIHMSSVHSSSIVSVGRQYTHATRVSARTMSTARAHTHPVRSSRQQQRRWAGMGAGAGAILGLSSALYWVCLLCVCMRVFVCLPFCSCIVAHCNGYDLTTSLLPLHPPHHSLSYCYARP
jgi:hypothetical protein